jgi:hypothetical protein
MSHLIEFLDEMFGASSGATVDDIKTRFSEDFGVDVQHEDGLFLFKYDMIRVKWNDVTRECRGVIVHFDGVRWKYVSRPPDKFFNLREGHGEYSSEAKFKENIDSLRLEQKADGSSIQVYHWNGSWRASTLGRITPLNVSDYGVTFDALFWSLFKGDMEKADPKICYFHELCSQYNIIVTQYPEDCLFLLTARNVETGKYLSATELDEVAISFNEKRPISYSVKELGIDSLVGLEEFAEREAADPKYGKNSEGFVLSDGSPVAKIKNAKYLSLHRVMTGGTGYTINTLIDLFFNGQIDDFYADLTTVQQSFIDALKDEASRMNTKIEMFFREVPEGLTQKEFAMKVMGDVDVKRFQSYIFRRFAPKSTDSMTFSEWLVGGSPTKKNWESFTDTWKSLFTIN